MARAVNPVGVMCGVVLCTLAALTSLTGCSIAPATAGELRVSFASSLAETQLLLDSSWENRDDPVARACTTDAGAPGTQTPALRITSGSFDAPRIAGAVAAAWSTWGYTVTVSEFALSELDAVSEVQAHGVEGEYLILRVSEVAATLQGESACTPTP